MKLIDRYLLRSLIVPFAFCFLAFVMIYTVFDLFDNLGDFIDAKTPLIRVAQYYGILMPSVLVRIVPISLLCAVLYSLYSLTKNNELTAMRASGISLLRLMVPVVSVGFVCSLGVALINESVGPLAAFWCEKFVAQQRKFDKGVNVYVANNLALSRASQQRMWFVREFDIREYDMTGIQIIQRRPDGKSEEYKLLAETGEWIDGRWWFRQVQIQHYDEGGNPKGPPRFEISRAMTDITETPRDFLNEIKDPGQEPDMFSARELATYIRSHPEREPKALIRIEADLHSRLAMPWACLIVTLIGVPFGNQTGRKGALLGIGAVLGLFLAYYVFTLTGLWLAKQGFVPPWVGGWLPIVIFLPLGITMLIRMR